MQSSQVTTRNSQSPWRTPLAQAALAGAMLLTATAAPAAAASATPAAAASDKTIDLAICLDTSGSMDGLIDAARTKIWDIVSDLALAKPTPKLRVALLTFGNQGNDSSAGWVRVHTTFTDDLDLVSKELFALTTNGGDEYVGRVVAAATELSWADSPDGMRLIVVAGNESADQDPTVKYIAASQAAIAKGIMVDSIYCGNPADELAPAWREVAKLADGQFAAIDQNNGTITITTPFDARLAELSSELNKTYLGYGSAAKEASANQWAQDANALASGSSVVAERCFSKGSEVYSNSRWDLVDALEDGSIKLSDIKPEDLPEQLKGKSPQEQTAIIDEARKQRKLLQAEVQALASKRRTLIDEELTKRNADSTKSFDLALRKAIREQATAKGFSFQTP